MSENEENTKKKSCLKYIQIEIGKVSDDYDKQQKRKVKW